MEIEELEDLKKHIELKGIKCYICESCRKSTLYCNGFSIKYNKGTYLIQNIKDSSNSRNISNFDDIFEYVTSKFYSVKVSSLTKIANAVNLYRNNGANLIRELRRNYPVSKKQEAKIKRINRQLRDSHSGMFIAREILIVLQEKTNWIKIIEARKLCQSMIPNIPEYCHVSVPLNRNQVLDGGISVRDFVILNAFYEYPVFIWRSLTKKNLLGSLYSGTKGVYTLKMKTDHNKKNIHEGFWKEIDPYKDIIYDQIIQSLIEAGRGLVQTKMSGRGYHILQEIATCYGIECVKHSTLNKAWVSDNILSKIPKNILVEDGASAGN